MSFLSDIFSALINSGPLGLICALELAAIIALGYGLWYFVKQRGTQANIVKSHAGEVKKLQEGQLERIDALHEHYQKEIAALNEKRILDVKEMTEDYSTLATQVGETINRLTLQLEIRGGRK